jgi:formylglycine-generating enzyme required for sulfatase activity
LATIFIHHAPRDEALAEALAQALRGEGFSARRCETGPVWFEALRTGRDACRVVVDLVTDAWRADPTVLVETAAAQRMGKPTLEVDADSLGLGAAGLTLDSPEGSALVESLRRLGADGGVGPDPAAFGIDPEAPPYPGLTAFGDADADAAVFFGRGREVVELLEILRAQRANDDRRALLVVGPEGSGTSSLVAAGLLPRLRREAPAWTVLRVVKTRRDPLGALARSIAATLADFGVEADATTWRDRLEAGFAAGPRGVRECLRAVEGALREASGRPHSVILAAVDPDERFVEDDAESGAALVAYLREAVRGATPWRVLVPVGRGRADALEAQLDLPGSERYELRPLPAFRYDEVVIGPAERYGLSVDLDLVHDLIEDVPPRGGLRRLAFALERLWAERAEGSGLLHEDYVAAGRLPGLLAHAPAEAGLASAQDRGAAARRWPARAGALVALSLLVLLVGAGLSGALAAQWRYWTIERPFRTQRVAPFVLGPEAERALGPGDVFRECDGACPEMVVVPAGSFVMGDEQERDATSLPRHRVTIARPFAVGRTEVTFEQYELCIEQGGCGPWIRQYRVVALSGRKPVANLPRDAMLQYLRWLSETTGRPYRLLTSAEWEYVARAGTTTAYPWGDEMRLGAAHCRVDCGSPFEAEIFQERDFVVGTAPVASFAPNPFGLFDTQGNVWEVVDDCWHPTYRGAPQDGSAWRDEDGGDCSVTVVRGGSWTGTSAGLRSAFREWIPGTDAIADVGFRVARDLAVQDD